MLHFGGLGHRRERPLVGRRRVQSMVIGLVQLAERNAFFRWFLRLRLSGQVSFGQFLIFRTDCFEVGTDPQAFYAFAEFRIFHTELVRVYFFSDSVNFCILMGYMPPSPKKSFGLKK